MAERDPHFALMFTEEELLCLAQFIVDVGRLSEAPSLYTLDESDRFKTATKKITDTADAALHASRSTRR